MDTQDILLGAHVTHVRELKAEVAALKAANTALTDELGSLRAHFDLALLVAEDLKRTSRLQIWDGWNLILGATKEAHDRDDLLAQARACKDSVWIIFDGPKESVALSEDGHVRVSYTGGTGEQRADRLIRDFLRMATYLGLEDRITVRTNDKELLSTLSHLATRH